MEAEPIDLKVSRWRAAGSLAISATFCVACVWMLLARPKTSRGNVDPGSFNEFVAIVGLLLFGAAAAVLLVRLFRTGTVVSIGPQGIFDRRISIGWIPWAAIARIAIVEMNKQRWVVLQTDPGREASLPLTDNARRNATRPRHIGPPGLYVEAGYLEGGVKALLSAIDRFGAVQAQPDAGRSEAG